MKSILKKLLAIGVVAAIMVSAIGALALTLPPYGPPPESFWSSERPTITGDEVLVHVNGLYLHTIDGDASPFIENGRTMVPLRALAEAFEFEVDWYEDDQRITLERESATVILHINSDMIIANDEELRFYDAVPVIIDGRTFLPVRRLADILDIEVDWCDDARTAIFTRRVESAIADGINIFGDAAHRPIGVTATQNGLTMTVLQTIADRYNIYVVFEIVAECGYEFGEDVRVTASFIPNRFREGYQIGSLAGGGQTILDRSGNRITVLQFIHATAPFEEGTVTLDLWNIAYPCDDLYGPGMEVIFGTPLGGLTVGATTELLVGLEWDFTFADTTVTFEPNLAIPFAGQELTLAEISISPIAATLVLESYQIGNTPYITILLRDGSEVTFNALSTNAKFGGTDITYLRRPEIFEGVPREEIRYLVFNPIHRMVLSYRFDYIVTVEDIVSVNVGNATIPFN
ncbi:MAG: copper amine oxidase N-terminal domain-containing protein [Oscillospiraceae bacterium]|nr:copper amine oxidase N-terminal domain-containing protein [Oscillospiraceae bacterium]